MTKLIRLLLVILYIEQILMADQPQNANFAFKDRAAWAAACATLPLNIDSHSKTPPQSAFMHHPEIGNNKQRAWQEFEKPVQQFLQAQAHKLNNAAVWTNHQQPTSDFYDVSQSVFMPYAEKLELKPQQRVVFHGDFHGDIRSLMTELDQLEQQGILKPGSFELADKNVHLVFLGDYVDRGHYGAEVIYTILRLKQANPDNVTMVRGNHEDQVISDRYGFKDELCAKFGYDENKYQKIYRMYNFLPVVAYIGHDKDYLQCCHGGLEYGYNQQDLLTQSGKYDVIDKLQRHKFKNFLHDHEHHHDCCGAWENGASAFRDFKPAAPADKQGIFGFMWGDFVKTGEPIRQPGRGLAANENLAKIVLDYHNEGCDKKIRGVFRAHQHAGEINQHDPKNLMYELIASNGVYKIWRPIETGSQRSLTDGLVWTFNTAPDGIVNEQLNKKQRGYGFDAYAILTIQEKYEDWKLQVCNPMVINRSNFAKPQ